MINWAHVHLIINHFPVIGILGAILLLLYSLIRKSDEVRMVSLGVFVLIALITVPVFFTGQASEEIVKKLPGVTESIKVITALASERIAHFAFKHARQRGRKKVTAVHKANIMKVSDGLFLDSARKVSREYPDIQFDDCIVDALCMKLVMTPERFDVLLLSNLYGDIVSDLAAGLVGGLGVVPGANLGDQCAVFEAVHGSAPDIAGKGIANPLAIIFSGILMLRRMGKDDIADRIRNAAFAVLKRGDIRTPDLGGKASTSEFAEAIAREL